MSKNISIKEKFVSSASLSWLQHLFQDPEAATHFPNKSSRQVKSGHYVRVEPTPLPHPMLMAISPEVCNLIGLPASFCRSSPEFTRLFSGDMSSMQSSAHEGFQSWCTPYALSIFGNEMYENCPFKDGTGYGDGRAISIGEVLREDDGQGQESHARWEMQLKGAGQTPFCRGGDGRSVLRSSVREFLAEEAMHHLGVSTTRGLSLVVSSSEKVMRPWYSSGDGARSNITANDPRIAHYSPEERKQIVKEVNGQPNAMIAEHTAMACRVSPSFIRVGHLELFSRRYRAALKQHSPDHSACRAARKELRMLVEHMLFREFSGPPPSEQPGQEGEGPVGAALQARILEALRESSAAIALLTSQWMRVGYCQGNFNSDNCLVAGRTLDYGPFGFVERYERDWCMWSGGGEKYSFRLQHLAGERNFFSLATALAPLLDEDGQREVRENLIPSHLPAAEKRVEEAYMQKMGLLEWTASVAGLFEQLDALLEETEGDYTLFWRQLSSLPATFLPPVSAKTAPDGSGASESVVVVENTEGGFAALHSDETLLRPLEEVFYSPLSAENRVRWAELLRRWLLLLHSQHSHAHSTHSGGTENMPLCGEDISSQMRRVNPKYVPREWMLVDAYQAAARGDTGPLERLQELFRTPYEEHSREDEASFYRKMPTDLLDAGGLMTMT